MDLKAGERELRALMIAGLDGDAAAYRSLLSNLSRRLRGYFKGQLGRFGRGHTEAEDLMQEVLIAIHTHRDTYDRSQLFTPWVHAIARYKFLDHLRRTRTSIKDEPIDEAEAILATDDFEGVDSALDLEKLMTGLSPKTRRVMQFVKLDGLSVKDAATRTGMSESAVKVSVHRGLRALAHLISKESRS